MHSDSEGDRRTLRSEDYQRVLELYDRLDRERRPALTATQARDVARPPNLPPPPGWGRGGQIPRPAMCPS